MSKQKKPLITLMKRGFKRKAERRLFLAREPIERKIQRLIQLQEIANEVRRAAGRPTRRVWGKDTATRSSRTAPPPLPDSE